MIHGIQLHEFRSVKMSCKYFRCYMQSLHNVHHTMYLTFGQQSRDHMLCSCNPLHVLRHFEYISIYSIVWIACFVYVWHHCDWVCVSSDVAIMWPSAQRFWDTDQIYSQVLNTNLSPAKVNFRKDTVEGSKYGMSASMVLHRHARLEWLYIIQC